MIPYSPHPTDSFIPHEQALKILYIEVYHIPHKHCSGFPVIIKTNEQKHWALSRRFSTVNITIYI